MLAVAFILNDPLPVRLAGVILETDNQLTLPLTLQVAFDVTITVILLATGLGVHILLFSVIFPRVCVTVIVRVGAPNPVTVIVPVRALVVVLVAALILNEPFPRLVVGVIFETVNQWTLLLIFHVVFDVMLTVVVIAAAVVVHVLLDNVRVFARACVTLIVRVIPAPVTLICPVRAEAVVLAVALIRNVPFPTRPGGDIFVTDSQLTLPLIVQPTFDVMLTVTLLACG